jgi:hypothetical protein
LSHRTLAVLALACAASGALADTLVLRSGRRIEGELVAVRGGTIEFDEESGSTRRFQRSEVARIELSSWGGSGGGGNQYGGRPAGMREKDVSVAAATGWNDTGIVVRAGTTVYFEASGRVRWGPDRQHGPAGEGGNRHNANRPIPSRPGGALIGRIGGSDPFFIGDERGPIRMRESGTLSLGVNDDYLQDNSGSWRVRVYY